MKKIIGPLFIIMSVFILGTPSRAGEETSSHTEALNAYRSGDMAKATSKLEYFITKFPNSNLTPGSYMMLATTYVKTGKVPKAVEILKMLQQNFPNSPMIPHAKLLRGNLERNIALTNRNNPNPDPVSQNQQVPQKTARNTEIQQKNHMQIFQQAEAARLRRDNVEALKLFKILLASNPPAQFARIAKDRLALLEPTTAQANKNNSAAIGHNSGTLVFGRNFDGLKDTSRLAKKLTFTVDSLTSNPKNSSLSMGITIAIPDASIFVNAHNDLDDLILNDLRQRIIHANIQFPLKSVNTLYTLGIGKGKSLHNQTSFGLQLDRRQDGRLKLRSRSPMDGKIPGIYSPEERSPLETKILIAKLNGNYKTLARLSAQASANRPAFAKSTTGALQKLPLNSLSLYPIKYSYAALPGYKSIRAPMHPNRQAVWAAVNDFGFPFGQPLSVEQLSAKLDTLEITMKRATEKAKALYKTIPKDSDQRITGFPPATRKHYAETIFFPFVRHIQSQMIQILANIPRTEEALELSKKIYQALFLYGDRYLQRWQDVFYDPNDQASYSKLKDPLTQQRLDYIRYNSNLIFKAWKLAYFREMDPIITAKLEKEGADFNLLLIGFVFDLGERVQLSSLDNDNLCLYSDCSSRFRAEIKQQANINEYSPEKLLSLIADLDKRTQDYLSQWKTTPENYKLQSDMALFARDKAAARLKILTRSALARLDSITGTNINDYNQWQAKFGKPIRLLMDRSQRLFEIGFHIKKEDSILAAFRFSGGNDANIHSPYHTLATSFIVAQLRWLEQTEKGTIADPEQVFPTTINDNAQTSFQYRRPLRFRNRLITPNELLFDGMGEQAGKAAAGFLSYASQIKALENRVKTTRAAFFSCYPNCADIGSLRKKFSRALIEKDLYFLKMTGESGSFLNNYNRRVSVVIEAMTPTAGITLIDNGIPQRCRNLFARWTTAYGKAHGQETLADTAKSFAALTKILSGDLAAAEDFKKTGTSIILKQQKAFKDTKKQYGPYQLCRDQWEFDYGT